MEEKNVLDAANSLVEPGVFALLAVRTAEGEVVLRPIGGPYGAGIRDAIQEMAEKYPGAKMRLLERNYRDFKMYFDGIVPKQQLL